MHRIQNYRTPEEEYGMPLDYMVTTCILYSFFICTFIYACICSILEYLEIPEIIEFMLFWVNLMCVGIFAHKMTTKWRRKYVKKKKAAWQAAKRLEELLPPAIAHVDTKVPIDIMQHCERLRGDNETLERELRRYRAEERIDDTDAIMLIRVYASRLKKNKESSERLAAVFGGTYGIEEY